MSDKRRSSMEKNEAAFDPLSAMLMEEQAAKPTAPTSKRVSGFDLTDLEKDLGVSKSKSSLNLTPSRAGANRVSVGTDDTLSPAPMAVPPPEDEADDTILEDPFEDATTVWHPKETATPVVASSAAKSKESQEESQESQESKGAEIGSTATLASTEDTTSTSTSTTGSTSTSSTSSSSSSSSSSESDEKSVAMRVSHLDAETITRIRRESSCAIVVDSRYRSSTNPKEQSVTITGSPSNVRSAQSLIRRHVSETEAKVEKVDVLLEAEMAFLDSKKTYVSCPIFSHSTQHTTHTHCLFFFFFFFFFFSPAPTSVRTVSHHQFKDVYDLPTTVLFLNRLIYKIDQHVIFLTRDCFKFHCLR